MILYFTGIDGSGKSTLVDDIQKHLIDNKVETLRIWARYSPRFSKMIVNIAKKKAVNHTGNYNTISEEEYSRWQSFKKRLGRNKIIRDLIFTFFYLDYYFQILSVQAKIKKNKNKVILIDRFVIDFLADQMVNFGDLSGTGIFRRIIKISNSFDAVFFISVKPDVALKRKSDIPGKEYLIERDIVFREIFKELDRGHIIDNNGPRDLAIREIMSIINL